MKVIPMQQPNRNLNNSHLTPIENKPDISPAEISDRILLIRFLENYRKTGRCESLPQLQEIARLAYQRQLTSPKQARALLSDLDHIESSLPGLFNSLSALISDFGENIKNGNQPDSKQRFELLDSLTETIEFLERLTAIARNHPDAPEPGFEEGFASCYLTLIKQVNDVRYGLSYLQEYLRPQALQNQLSRYPNPDLKLITLITGIEDLYITVMLLIPRLRENVTRQVPQFWGSVEY
ncbi:hypothetical protein [Arthrospira sp. PLM2.Bin9]|uniref:hypothetical protein n=2 Tax=Oscillatoriophycideae TaxID=1301283 RepID=UPI0029429FA6|nr:hypothetical protein [Arthrospira sp. PLM2.Bin9]